jgi:hypothetical protein
MEFDEGDYRMGTFRGSTGGASQKGSKTNALIDSKASGQLLTGPLFDPNSLPNEPYS